MALSMRALANRHCSSRAVSMRAASSFSGSSFLRGAITSRSAPADHFPAPASSVVVPVLLLLRLLLGGSQGPLAAAPGPGMDRRGCIKSACASVVGAAPALPLFSLLLSVRRGGGATAAPEDDRHGVVRRTPPLPLPGARRHPSRHDTAAAPRRTPLPFAPRTALHARTPLLSFRVARRRRTRSSRCLMEKELNVD